MLADSWARFCSLGGGSAASSWCWWWCGWRWCSTGCRAACAACSISSTLARGKRSTAGSMVGYALINPRGSGSARGSSAEAPRERTLAAWPAGAASCDEQGRRRIAGGTKQRRCRARRGHNRSRLPVSHRSCLRSPALRACPPSFHTAEYKAEPLPLQRPRTTAPHTPTGIGERTLPGPHGGLRSPRSPPSASLASPRPGDTPPARPRSHPRTSTRAITRRTSASPARSRPRPRPRPRPQKSA
jgi:hypothetical protein